VFSLGLIPLMNKTDKAGIEVDTITLPSYWASALINGDYSGLNDGEAQRCKAEVDFLAGAKSYVVSDVEDSQRFTWHYNLYDPEAGVSGGEVMDYVIHKL
jgi:Ca2+-binding RTX toxin-like protein